MSEIIGPQVEFDRLAGDLRKLLDEEKDTPFKIAAVQSLQTLEITPHRNNLVALQVLAGCVSCYYNGDESSARVLMFVAGTIVNDYLCPRLWEMLVRLNQPGQAPNI
jgi:hypothetical protein